MENLKEIVKKLILMAFNNPPKSLGKGLCLVGFHKDSEDPTMDYKSLDGNTEIVDMGEIEFKLVQFKEAMEYFKKWDNGEIELHDITHEEMSGLVVCFEV